MPSVSMPISIGVTAHMNANMRKSEKRKKQKGARVSILIKGMRLEDFMKYGEGALYLIGTGQAVELPDHGDLIDMSALNDAMFHEAFETDSDMQKWDSGCWIRYKMFEKYRDLAPVIIPAERG